MRKTQVHTWIAMFFCVLAVAAEALQERRDPSAVLRRRRQPMQSLPAPAAALFRFLDDERLDYCVLGRVTSPVSRLHRAGRRARRAGADAGIAAFLRRAQ